MGWFVGVLAGALIGTGACTVPVDARSGNTSEATWRAGAPADRAEERHLPLLQPTRAPRSEPGSEGDEPQIRPPVQRGPDDFYRKPPRERKPRDRMYA